MFDAGVATTVGLVTLGFSEGQSFQFDVTRQDLANGYGASQLFARGGTELLSGVLTGGLSTLSKGGKAVQIARRTVAALDFGGNVVGTGQGVIDLAQNRRLTFANAAQIGGGLLGIVGAAPQFRFGAAPARATRGLADEIASVGPPRSRQTISLIETRQGQTIVSGGSTDLTAAQKALARKRGLLVADDLPGFHAEVTGVATAGRLGLTPTRGVTNNRVCRDGAKSCASQLGNLADEGGFGFRLSTDGRSFEFISPSGER